jgi:hypothetical protein
MKTVDKLKGEMWKSQSRETRKVVPVISNLSEKKTTTFFFL